MKCGNCGHEFEKGIFCPECGTRYEAEKLMVEDAPQDKQSNDTNNNMNGGEDETSSVKKKVPWYVNGFFILIVFYFFKIPGVILCLIRLIKCKERRKITVITAILVLFIPYLTSAYKDTQIENNTSYQSKADYDNNISYQSEADYDKGSSKLSANGNFYTPITFPYKNKKASKLIDLYEKALEHQENLIYIQPDKVVRNHAYSYKQTIEWSEYLYYGDIKDGKPHGQGLIFKDSLIIYMGDFSKGSLNGYGIRFSEDSEIGIKYEGEWKDGQYNGDGIEYVGYDNDTVLNQIREYYDNQRELNEDLGTSYANQALIGMKCIIDKPFPAAWISYDGSFKKGEKSGKGKEYYIDLDWDTDVYLDTDIHVNLDEDEDKDKVYLGYEGEFKDGKYNGKGTLYYPPGNQVQYKGEFKDGKYNGKGTLYNQDGSVNHKGKFKDGNIK